MPSTSSSSFTIHPTWRGTCSGPDGWKSRALIEKKLVEKRFKHSPTTTTGSDLFIDDKLPPILLPPSSTSTTAAEHHRHHPIISPDLQATSANHLRWILKATCLEAALQFHHHETRKKNRDLAPSFPSLKDFDFEECESPLSDHQDGTSYSTITSVRDILKKISSQEESDPVGASSNASPHHRMRVSSLRVFSRKSTKKSSTYKLALGATTTFPLKPLLDDLDTMTNERAVDSIIMDKSRGCTTEEEALRFLFTFAREQLLSFGMFSF